MSALRSRALAALAAALAAGACSLAPRLTDPVRYPSAAVRLPLAPYVQEPEGCGPFALAAVLGHLGIAASPSEMTGRLRSTGAGGVLTMDLYLEATRRGVPARQGRGTFETVARDLERGAPSVLLLRYPALGSFTGHFVAVSGYSRAPRGLFLLWGDGRESWMGAEDLERMWERSGFWTLSVAGGGAP